MDIDKAIDFLEDYNIEFSIHNNGYQINIRFMDNKEIVAFYPTTEKWVHRGKTYKGNIINVWNWIGEMEEGNIIDPFNTAPSTTIDPNPYKEKAFKKGYIEIFLTRRAVGNKADLFTDGVDEFWIPHSQIDYKNSRKIDGENWELSISEWIAKIKEII